MKKVFACLVFLGLLMASPLAYAQTTKVGVFDIDRVFNESKRWSKERDAFVKWGKQLQQDFEKKAAELKEGKGAGVSAEGTGAGAVGAGFRCRAQADE
jgi:Skp family chaperone for outer membrane proteins